MLNWAITFFLLAVVSVFFVFAGTEESIVSLLGRLAAASCLVMAVVMFAFHAKYRPRNPRAG